MTAMSSNNSNNSNRGVILQGRARDIIYNINKVFESEKLRANELLRDLNLARIQGTTDGITISHELFAELTGFLKASLRVTERVVLSTGVNKNTVTRIKREGTKAEAAGSNKITTPVRKPRGKSVVLNNYDLYALSKLITGLYLTDNDVPSLSKILAKARSELNFKGSMTTLRRILVGQLGYKFTRGIDQSKQITIVRPNIGCNSSDEDVEREYETEVQHIETAHDNIDTFDSKKGTT